MSQVIGVSMDTTTALFDWLDSNTELKDFNVPLMSDRDANISRRFGVLQKSFMPGQVIDTSLTTPQMRSGFPANSVFIVDGEDRVRHHTVLDSRAAFSVDEVARLVAAYKATDGGQVSSPATTPPQHLAMAGWKEEGDTVTNDVPSIQHFYGTKYGDKEHSCEGCPKQPSGTKKEVTARGQQEEGYKTKEEDRCSDCPGRKCDHCPAKEQEEGDKTKEEDRCSDCPARKCDHYPSKEDRKEKEKGNEGDMKDMAKGNYENNEEEKTAAWWAFWRR